MLNLEILLDYLNLSLTAQSGTALDALQAFIASIYRLDVNI